MKMFLPPPTTTTLLSLLLLPALYADTRPVSYPAPQPAYLDYDEPPLYAFNYGVDDQYTGANFGQDESRDGYNTQGSYRVALPDGRTLVVTYTVNGDSGLVADVKYEGEARYDTEYDRPNSYQPAQPAASSYKPAVSSYRPAPVQYKPSPAPVQSKPSPAPLPVDSKPVPTSVVYQPAPTPAVYRPAPPPIAYQPAPSHNVYRSKIVLTPTYARRPVYSRPTAEPTNEPQEASNNRPLVYGRARIPVEPAVETAPVAEPPVAVEELVVEEIIEPAAVPADDDSPVTLIDLRAQEADLPAGGSETENQGEPVSAPAVPEVGIVSEAPASDIPAEEEPSNLEARSNPDAETPAVPDANDLDNEVDTEEAVDPVNAAVEEKSSPDVAEESPENEPVAPVEDNNNTPAEDPGSVSETPVTENVPTTTVDDVDSPTVDTSPSNTVNESEAEGPTDESTTEK